MSAPPRFTFDPRSMRYRDARGRFISGETVHGWIVDYSNTLGKSLRDLTDQLRTGSLDLRSWQLQMAQNIKDAHLATGIAAKGGKSQMTPADWGRLGNIIKGEYQYLNRLVEGIADGSIPLDGRVLQRAEQYGKAARETYMVIERREYQLRGKTEERNVRGKHDSCEAGVRPGCVEETARGWVSIGTLSHPGSRTCLGNCGCRLEFR